MELSIEMRGYSDFASEIGRLLDRVKNKLPFFAEAKVIMFADVQRHFQAEEGPSGEWPALKYRKGKALQDTGRLRASITGVHGSSGAEVGTNIVYSETHQFGVPAKNIPARTFIWMSGDAEAKVIDSAVKYFWEAK